MPTVKPQTGQPEVVDDSDPEQQNEVTRPSDLGFGPKPHTEIEVQPINEPAPQVGEDGMVEIRMARTIEEFTYGNPHVFYRLEEGKRYRVPVHITRYLFDMGALYLRS